MYSKNAPPQTQKISAKSPLSSLRSFSLQTGIPRRILKTLNSDLQAEKNPRNFIDKLNQENPALAELALEQGYYQLALDLGTHSALSTFKALIFTGNKKAAQEFLDVDTHLAIERSLMTVLFLRTQGQAQKAIKEVESILAHIADLNLETQGEAYLSAGSVYFNISAYDKSAAAYKQAYDIYQHLQRPGKAAIAAFNASISLSYLNQKIDSTSWRWRAEEILENYHLESLELSMTLARLEQLVAAKKFSEAQPLADVLLKEQDLSVVQRLLTLQGAARIYIELGEILEGEGLLHQSRQLMIKNEFYQYEIFQRVLELDTEVLVHHRVVKSQLLNSPHHSADIRQSLDYKIAQARKAWIQNDLPRCLKLAEELERDQRSLPEDLAILLHENFHSVPQSLRAQEIFFFLAASKQKTSALRQLSAVLSEVDAPTPWQKILQTLTMVVLSRYQTETTTEFIKPLSQALQLAEASGLERLATISLGFISIFDPHQQKRWVQHLNNLEDGERAWVENFFKKSMNVNIIAAKWVVQSESSALICDQDIQEADLDVLIYPEKGKISLRGQEVPVRGLLLKLLVALARAKSQGLSKEDLVKKVWEQEYDPTMHDAVIYTNIARLRDLLKIDCDQGIYRLSGENSWALVETAATKGLDLNERQRAILKFLESDTSIQRSQVVSLIKASERTALRELTDLVRRGLLQKSGSGRSVSYRRGAV